MTRTTRAVVEEWHDLVATGDTAALRSLLAEDCVFLSPVVHTPQEGRRITSLYLASAMRVFAGSGFTYVGETVEGDRAVLEFTADLDGTAVHGVDVIDVEDGRIARFTVMVRPLRGMEELRRRMALLLAEATAGGGG